VKSPANLPIPALKALRKLGQDVNFARRRHRISIELMAERSGLSKATISKVEKGDPTASMGAYSAVLFVLGLTDRLNQVADASHDLIGRQLEEEKLPKRIHLTGAAYHTTVGTSVFGAIGDSAPDRWGRVLMRRAESIKAKAEKRRPVTLFEADYLLGVNDEARQGALRFSLEVDEPVFLSAKNISSIPPLVDLAKLLSATERFLEEDESPEDLKLLLAPGSSLGGARPKASVRDLDGSLAIAKFPRRDDEYNIVVWEAVALSLAKLAGIKVPDWRLETILNKPVLITKRFDRSTNGRIPFLSAMSMLGARDNEEHSYLEIAYAIVQNGASTNKDLAELWRRIVFSIMISNTDDHLRNHGFIYERNHGWRLSPVYDINPTPIEIKPRVLTTAIDYKVLSYL
jgi:serine/threonine-protein kinase HipA